MVRHKFSAKILPFLAGVVLTGTVFLFTGKNTGSNQEADRIPEASLAGMQICMRAVKQMEEETGVFTAKGAVTIKKDDAPLWAQAGIVFTSGIQVAGVFDESREIINFSAKHQGNRMELFVNGVEQLDVPDTYVIWLADMLETDAYLELMVGEPVRQKIREEKNYFRITAYHVHQGELVEVPLLPSGEDNSFYVDEWCMQGEKKPDFSGRFNCYIYDFPKGKWVSQMYQMTPDGYLEHVHDATTLIYVDGKLLKLSEKDVEVDESTGVGIALEGMGATGGHMWLNIYRSEDGGENWSMVCEMFGATTASTDKIYIIDENRILLSFDLNGRSPSSECYATLDGGVTWERVENAAEMKKYSFLMKRYKDW